MDLSGIVEAFVVAGMITTDLVNLSSFPTEASSSGRSRRFIGFGIWLGFGHFTPGLRPVTWRRPGQRASDVARGRGDEISRLRRVRGWP